jgi:D-3-phosphoglycerate dehydrogenase
VSEARKYKVVVQAPRGPSFDLGDETYSLEREALDPIGAEIVEIDADSTAEFVSGAAGADAVIARFRRIHEGIIQGLESCLVIGCGSVGTDTVDVDAATEAGIVVTNVPDVFIEEVADHALMLLLGAVRRVNEMDRMVREGEWGDGRPAFVDVPRLWGQTLGLISFGNVARAVARRAKPFGLHVLAWDPYVSELEMTAEGVEPVGLGELLQRSDIVSLHAPLNEETTHLMNTERFSAMKRGSIFVNTGRGPCVDETALVAALEEGQVAVAALDVLEVEPPAPDNPLLAMRNVLLTPHIASATSRMMPETRRRLGRELATVLQGKWPRSCVNPHVLPRAPLQRWQPVPMTRGPNR